MTPFDHAISWLQADMETPASYGLFHIVACILTLLAAAFSVWRFRDADDKTARRILFGAWVVLVALEVYKQLVFSMDVTDGIADWSYKWYAFPFQFCSSPLYVLPFAVFPRSERIRNAVMAFLATFSLFGGLAVMAYPGDVFISMIGINIQTMVHHGSQIVLGVFAVALYRKRLSWRFFLGGLVPFCVLSAAAMGLNLAVPAMLNAHGITDFTFNMFYVARDGRCSIPVLSWIQANMPYPVFFISYVLTLGFGGGLVTAGMGGIRYVSGWIREKRKKSSMQ
jgi:hypothetical protein